MTTPTAIHFPEDLPFPFKILSLAARPSDSIQERKRLLNYSFIHIPGNDPKDVETRYGTWDATFEGELHAWKVKAGDLISRQRAKAKPALLIVESCKHGIQVNGLCALCGMDMENFDYTGRPESSRATIQMTHSATGPTVSLEEAQRIEHETAEHLLKSRKLSLIVDLDQTIVHATVDPTVGEWIAEGEAWEARRAKRVKVREREEEGAEDVNDENPGSDDKGDEEEVNPNWEALKDVKKFRLAADVFNGPPLRGALKDKGKEKAIENDGCLYYVKPRPGWQEFLTSAAAKYEMHVYTMGTRAYAEEVCAAIDPEGQIFGGRILSRDESGSLTQKSLRRLFPCDTSMVVIIDDRADVWEWSPNLVKVIPYDFYVGIGDINSAFLPKVDPLSPAIPQRPSAPAQQQQTNDLNSDVPLLIPPVTVPSSPVPTASSSPPADIDPTDSSEEASKSNQDLAKKDLITQNTLALEAQVEQRPLAKKQEELLETNGQAESEQIAVVAPQIRGQQNASVEPESTQFVKVKAVRKALLKNDDTELIRVGKLLDDVHQRFFDAYDSRIPVNNNRKRRRHSLAKQSPPPKQAYDVKIIIPQLRLDTFAGVHILFSGVIPTHPKIDHENTEIWRMARAFGATCHTDLSREITHVVTSKRGTQKVEKAQKQGGMYIVWLSWFTDSIARWRRQEERLYQLDEFSVSNSSAPTVSSPPSDPTAISSDTDPEGTIDDQDADSLERESKEDIPISAEMTDVNAENFDMGGVDWQNVHDEVEAAMMESDSDEEQSTASGRTSGNVSDEEGSETEETSIVMGSTQVLHRSRKRLRSATPSEHRLSIDTNFSDADTLRSPLAKRKKLTAERTGLSKLKETVSASDISQASDEALILVAKDKSATPSPKGEDRVEVPSAGGDGQGGEGGGSEDGEDDEDDEDDFLARELEEEWG